MKYDKNHLTQELCAWLGVEAQKESKIANDYIFKNENQWKHMIRFWPLVITSWIND